MDKCKYLRDGIESLVPGISRLVHKVYHSTKCHLICLTFQKLSKSSQALKFGFTARQSRNRWQTVILGTKLATRANKWEFRTEVYLKL
ncbi:MAG: hypothetical protein A3C06_03730 [Candidatus Taylorbacteria bacterium RIFCSPHIGHO2_02_FULL_46_13]|uniref:Uncharacterized protein n=1 Tax=Candidatus Taylorbacteria bacterium RIFCSPHIGHO2_02_FULL_46_13 TaxID=1802312 RepID=A0A1G2MTC3_9BACT|nr:MAG: hypothetical protein A3C06_03730 [Candidatus Taylorbacteria bacterium RIFCSPHIGHO2_02_FULL_46_13]